MRRFSSAKKLSGFIRSLQLTARFETLKSGKRKTDTPKWPVRSGTPYKNYTIFAEFWQTECRSGAEEIPLIPSLTFDLGFWRAFHVPEVFGLFWNIGSDSSSVTHGNLSSSQIAFCGANGVGSSSDAIVTSTVSESLVPRKTNACRNMRQKSESDSHARSCAVHLLLRPSPRGVRIPK